MEDKKYNQIWEKMKNDVDQLEKTKYAIHDNDLLTFKDIFYVLDVPKIKQLILDEHHKRPLLAHQSYQKIILAL